MNYAYWSDVFRVIAIVASFVTVMATVGHFVCGKVAERAKSVRIEELEKNNRILQTKVTAVHDYSEVARLNTQGKPFPDGDIAFNSPLSIMMDGTYHLEGNTFFFHRTPEAEVQLHKVVEKYPEFPFAHYALALCMHDRNDPEWRTEAVRARDIFQITTSLPGHQSDHDDALARLNRLLQQ